MKSLFRVLGAAALIALTSLPASADLFDNGGPLCSVLSIGCPPPPPPPPPPAPEPVAPPPVKHVRKVHKPKAKTAEAPASDAAAPAAAK